MIALSQQHPNNLHKDTFPNAEEELVEWAKQKFGGVTSFTTVQNPQMVNWTSSSGKNWSSTDLGTLLITLRKSHTSL